MSPLVWAVLAFIATAVIIILVGFAVTSQSARAGARLRDLTGPAVPAQPAPKYYAAGREDMLPTVTRFLSARKLTEGLYAELASAGLPVRPSEYVGVIAAAVILSQIIAVLVMPTILGHALFAVFGLATPITVVKSLQQKRRIMFDNQIVDALILIASSIRSGFSFLRAMQMVAQEMPPPISIEFERIINEVNIGRPMEDALRASVQRVKSYDFDLVVTAVLIQLQVGGNLADILETIADTIRDRMRISGEIRTLTAEGRISGIALVLIPVFLGVVLTILNPGYMHTLFYEKVGHYMLAGAAVLQIVGAWIIKRMLVLEY
jgi:tight adherence protein B